MSQPTMSQPAIPPSQDAPDSSTEKPVRCRCRPGCRGCLIVVILLAPLLYWVGCHTTRLRVSEETTYVLGPMTSDGKRIDYFRAMEERYYPPEMQTDDNGYRMMVQTFGVQFENNLPQNQSQEQARLQIYEKLGLDPNIEPTMKPLNQPLHYLLQHRYVWEEGTGWVNTNIEDAYWGQTFWTFNDFPMLEEWYEENTAGLDVLAEAVRKPAFFVPYTRNNENTPIFDTNMTWFATPMMRGWARSLHGRARYRLGIGDIDGAIDDILSIHLLARHAVNAGTIVGSLVGIAFEGIGHSIGLGSNPEFPPTKEQIERLVAELDALPPLLPLNAILESERLFALSALQDMYWGNHPGNEMLVEMTVMPSSPAMSWTIDINVALARLNQVYDALIDPDPVGDKFLEQVFASSCSSCKPFALVTTHSRTNRFMDLQIGLFIPAMQAWREAYRRNECQANMQRLTLALLLYKQDHGNLPDGDWRESVLPYLGDDAGRYFQCPASRLANNETNYVMISGVPNGIDTPNRILLIEAMQPQKLGEGDGSLPFVQAMFGDQSDPGFAGLGSTHAGIASFSLRSGAVRSLARTTEPEVLQSLLDGTATAIP